MVPSMTAAPLRRNRDFVLLWAGQALSQLGTQASTVAFPLLVLALGGSAAQAGVVGLAKWLPLVLAAVPAGELADRLDRKRLMIACDMIRALLLLSIPAALLLGRPQFLQIAAVAFLDGCLFTVTYVTERGALRQVVDVEQLPAAVTQNEARLFAANILGPPLGGLLFAAARALPFLADAVSYVASTGALALTRSSFQAPASDPDQPFEPRSLRGLVSGFTWLWNQSFFRTSALLFAGGNPMFTGLYLLAILLAKRGGASSGEVGAMFAVVGAGGLAGALAVPVLRRRLAPARALVAESWIITAAVPLLFLTREALLIGLIVAAAEFLTPLANSVVAGHRVAVTPDRLQGRVQAAATLVTMSLAWLGPLVVGLLFGQSGASVTVAVLTGWALLLALITSLAPAIRRGPPAWSAGGPGRAA